MASQQIVADDLLDQQQQGLDSVEDDKDVYIQGKARDSMSEATTQEPARNCTTSRARVINLVH